MKTGPHRKLQLLGGTSSSSSALQNMIQTAGMLDSDDNALRSKFKTNLNLNQLGNGQHTPNGTAAITLTSGRSNNGGPKTPQKQQEKVQQSPRPSIVGKHNPRTSVSQNQLSYSMSNSAATNVNSSKAFQPVLRKEKSDVAVNGFSPGRLFGTTKNSGSSHVRKQTGSCGGFNQLVEKVNQKNKSGCKPVVIKEKPFNYEERQTNTQKSADQLMRKSVIAEDSLANVTKSLTRQYEDQTPQSIMIQPRILPEVQIQSLELFSNDPNLPMTAEDRDEVRMRPSDEVSLNQDQQLLLAFGSGFTHSRIGSGLYWNNTKGGDTHNNSSYRAFIEENRSDAKMNEHDYIHMGNGNDEKFEVIREDLKDSFYSPQHIDQRDNSDFKKFNADEDFQSQMMDSRWLQRMANSDKMAEPFNSISLKEMKTLEHSGHHRGQLKLIGIAEVDAKHDEMEDTPTNIKERAKQSYFEQQIMKSDPTLAGQNAFSTKNNEAQYHQMLNFGTLIDNPLAQAQNQAHILSFSEDNPHYNQEVIQHGLMHKDHISSFQFESRPQTHLLHHPSDNVAMDVIKSSQINPQSANAIIEMEKNYVILQYETLLQQLSSEFQKVLTKTKQTDEHLAQQELLIQTQQKILNEKEAAYFQQEQLNSQLSIQVQELLQELENFTIEKSRRHLVENQNEAQAVQKDLLEQTLQNLQSKVRLYESTEICIKDQIESSLGKLRMYEARLRHKDEEIFAMQRLNSSQERDLQNMREIELNLKLEVQRGVTSRLAAEDTVQDMRQKLCADQILIRVRENELENVSREYKAVKGSLEIFQQSYSQVMRENDQLKGTINEHERAGIQMKSLFQTRDVQTAQLESDVQRLTAIIEKERQIQNQVEEDYRRKIENMQKEMREMQSRREFEALASNNRSYDNRETQRNQNAVSFQESNQGTQRYMHSNGEQMNANILSPYKQEIQQKPQVSWLYDKPNESSQQQSSVVPQAYQNPNQQRDDTTNQQTNRRKSVNPNATLHTWDPQPPVSQGVPTAQSYKSVERSNVNANLFGHGRQDNLRQSQQSNPYGSIAVQFSPRGNASRVNNSFNFEQEQQQAAGKKSTAQTSPFAVTQEVQQKQLAHLSNTLSAMQIDKERVENEYRKLGTSKNKQQIEKKRVLEFDIEVIDKNIHQIKQKLREMNAL